MSLKPTLRLPYGTQVDSLHGKRRVAALRDSKYLYPLWTPRLYVGRLDDGYLANQCMC
jgi:hypothetical protein